MKKSLIIVTAFSLVVTPAFAQKKKAKPETVPQVSVETLLKQYRFSEAVQKIKPNSADAELAASARMGAEMLEATQQVVFVDSVVADAAQLLQAIRLNEEMGRLTTYNDFFHSNEQSNDMFAYCNEIGDKCFFAQDEGSGGAKLFGSERIGDKWTEAAPLASLNDNASFTSLNYPYMMPDGYTFYFAAKGAESLGGYDIFVTRYDAETHSFLKPENIGMPFNSPGNDYLYVVDELNNIGYFATDRNQPQGKVCIYAFVPSEDRKVYGAEEVSKEQLRSLARLDRIADTWANAKVKDDALARIAISLEKKETRKDNFEFCIDDATVYTSFSQFRANGNAERMKRLLDDKEAYKRNEETLEQMRKQYEDSSASVRKGMKEAILKMEQSQFTLSNGIRDLEKEIRRQEIASK